MNDYELIDIKIEFVIDLNNRYGKLIQSSESCDGDMALTVSKKYWHGMSDEQQCTFVQETLKSLISMRIKDYYEVTETTFN